MIRTRAVSPVEVLDAHLDAIARRNPALNAIVTLAADQARDAAQEAQAAVMRGDDGRGRLHGVPVGIKDVTETAGIRTTYASPLYADHVPAEDAEVVRRLKRAGAIVLAKTNTPEFAAGAVTTNALFGPTRNPWNLDYSPAGSSGGSAAAVAAGLLPLAQGTDFGGSVRVPASFCGICGIRPTPGLIPNAPMPLAWDFGQTHGPLARTVEDVALMLDAMVGFSAHSPISVTPPWASAFDAVNDTHDARNLRVAYVSDIAGIGVETEVDAICRGATLRLQDAGAQVEEISFDASDGRAPYMTLRGAWMVGQQIGRLDRLADLGDNLRGNIESGLAITTRDIACAERMRADIHHRLATLFERFDMLLTPVAPVKPFRIDEGYPRAINGRPLASYVDWVAPTFLITLVSLPAASVPAGKTADGLPVGLQVVAPRFCEPRILGLAKIVQHLNPIGRPPA